MAETYDGDIKLKVSLELPEKSLKELKDEIQSGLSENDWSRVTKLFKGVELAVNRCTSAVKNLNFATSQVNLSDNVEEDAKKTEKIIEEMSKSTEDKFKDMYKNLSKDVQELYKNSKLSAESIQNELNEWDYNNLVEQRLKRDMKLFEMYGKSFSPEKVYDSEIESTKSLIQIFERLEEQERKEAQAAQEAESFDAQREAEYQAKLAEWEEQERAYLEQQKAEQQVIETEKEEIEATENLVEAHKQLNETKQEEKISDEHIAELNDRILDIKAQLKAYEEKGIGFGYKQYDDLVIALNNATNELNKYKKSLIKKNEEEKKTPGAVEPGIKSQKRLVDNNVSLIDSLNRLRNTLHKLYATMKKVFNRRLTQHTSIIDEKSLKKGLRLILKYVIGVRSLFMLYRKLRTAGKQALQALAKESEEVNASMSNILTVFTQLKNSIATIIQPILNILAPVLVHIGEVANVVTEKIANFLAVLTGQSYYYRAKKVQKDYAESLGETAKNAEKAEQALSSIDKLDVISKNKGTELDQEAESLFEKVDVDKSANDLIESIKKAWKEADFTSVGEAVGTKFRDSLNSIPWGDIQDKANNTAKSISTMINGFVEVDGLGTSIGSNFAQLLNTMQQSLNTFLTETHWDSIGSFIADNIMGFATTFDGELLGKNIAGKFNAVSDLIKGFNSKMDWTKAGEFTSNIINGFFKTIKAKDLGKNISELLLGFIEMVDTFLDETDWEQVGRTVSDALTGIRWQELLGGVATVFFKAIKAAFLILKGFIMNDPEFALDIAIAIADVIALKMATAAVVNKIGNAIKAAITGSVAESEVLTLNVPELAIIAGLVTFAALAIQRKLPGQDVVEDTKSNKAQEDKYEAKQKQLADEQKKYNTYLNDKLQKYSKYLTALSKGTSLEQEILDINKEMEKIRNSSDSEELKARKLAIYEQELLTIYEYMIHDLEALDKQGKLNTSKYILRYDEATKHVVANLSTTNAHITEVRNNLGGTYTSANNASSSLQYMTDIAKQTAYAMAGIKDKKITVTADTTQADKNIKTTKTNLDNVKNKDVTVDVKPQKQNIIQKTWNDACTLIKKAINSGLIEPLNNLTITMNALGGGITSMLGNVGSGKKSNTNTTSQKIFTIPTLRLAQGAVIPANREFLAVLGDQKQGTNVEAPLATIEQALRNVLAENGGGVSTIQVMVDGKRMAEVVWNETEKRYRQTGKR